jgi:hypothetical protein
MKVLIVSPNFCPLNTPDMQRARLALPYLRAHGWEPTILAVAPEYAGTGVRDPLLEETYPTDIRVVRVRGLSPAVTRWLGFGTLWWRCGRALRRAGDALLSSERFDLVFFTTTVFNTFSFGPRWRKKFGVRYVLDYQDPWINRYYERTGTPPPGGPLKFGVSQWSARRREPDAVRNAAAIVTVSEAYRKDLTETYGLDPARVHLLPFGASPADLSLAGKHAPKAPLIDFADGNFHHVYVGRCGADMQLTLTVLFRAFRRFLETHPEQAGRMRFHFIGTDYAPPPRGREWVVPVATAENVHAYVHEHPYRVPYFDALHYLLRADALAVVGSNDPTYSASKVFPYILARRPTLLLFHQDSLVLKFAEEVQTGVRIGFGHEPDVTQLVAQVYERWFVQGGHRAYRAFNEEKFRPFTAESLTQQLAHVFDQAVGRSDLRSAIPTTLPTE